MPHKEIRKVTQIGQSFCVFLPKPWVRFNGLKAGSKIQVISNGDVKISLIEKREYDEKDGDKGYD